MDSQFVALFCPDRYYPYKETGFYYLQSRFYDPTLGRFINADSYTSTGQSFLGYNMFAYCGNNPIKRKDITGKYNYTTYNYSYEYEDEYGIMGDYGTVLICAGNDIDDIHFLTKKKIVLPVFVMDGM